MSTVLCAPHFGVLVCVCLRVCVCAPNARSDFGDHFKLPKHQGPAHGLCE